MIKDLWRYRSLRGHLKHFLGEGVFAALCGIYDDFLKILELGDACLTDAIGLLSELSGFPVGSTPALRFFAFAARLLLEL